MQATDTIRTLVCDVRCSSSCSWCNAIRLTAQICSPEQHPDHSRETSLKHTRIGADNRDQIRNSETIRLFRQFCKEADFHPSSGKWVPAGPQSPALKNASLPFLRLKWQELPLNDIENSQFWIPAASDPSSQ